MVVADGGRGVVVSDGGRSSDRWCWWEVGVVCVLPLI